MSGPIIVGPGEGEAASSADLVIKAPSELSSGAFTVIEGVLPSGASGPPMHLHRSHDESLYLIQGTLTVVTPDCEQEVGAGGYVFFPRGMAHTFTNRSDGPVRFVAIASGGLDRFIVELRKANDDAARRAVLERYESELV
jgi:quercetin dioxygenase-like cupin family protein